MSADCSRDCKIKEEENEYDVGIKAAMRCRGSRRPERVEGGVKVKE